MKCRRFLAAVFAALVLGGAAASAYETRPAILAHAGFGFPEENNLRGGWETGFGLLLPIARHLALAVEYAEWKDTSKQSFGKLYNGTLTLAPIQASLQLEFYQNMYFTAYALGGAAYIVSRFRIGSYPSVPDVTIEQRVDNGIALFGGLGANLALSKKVAFYFEASYMRRSLPAQTIVHDVAQGDSETPLTANLRHVFLRMGLKFLF
jgi:predicted porin